MSRPNGGVNHREPCKPPKSPPSTTDKSDFRRSRIDRERRVGGNLHGEEKNPNSTVTRRERSAHQLHFFLVTNVDAYWVPGAP